MSHVLLPTVGQRVRLRCGEVNTLTPVLAHMEKYVMLEGEHSKTAAAEIIFSHPHGVTRLAGDMSPGVRKGVAQFRIGEQIRLPQRRLAFRMLLELPAHVRRDRGQTLTALTADLSIGGVLLTNVAEIDVDEQVSVSLDLGDAGVVETAGRVIRAEDNACAVAFDPITARVENHIARFLASEQRRRMTSSRA